MSALLKPAETPNLSLAGLCAAWSYKYAYKDAKKKVHAPAGLRFRMNSGYQSGVTSPRRAMSAACTSAGVVKVNGIMLDWKCQFILHLKLSAACTL